MQVQVCYDEPIKTGKEELIEIKKQRRKHEKRNG